MQNIKEIFSGVTLFLFIVFMSSCGGSSGSSSSSAGTRTYSGTASPGDVWTWSLNYDNNTFTGISDSGHPGDATYKITISGTFAKQASGFLLLTATNVSAGSNVSSTKVQALQAAIAAGSAKAYGLEAPQLTFLVKPISGPMISALYMGTCDNVNGAYNWISTGFGSNADVTSSPAYGVVTFSGTSSAVQASISPVYDINGGDESSKVSNPPAGSCSNGVITFSSGGGGGGAASVLLSSSGGFVIDFGNGNGGVVGFKQSGMTASDVGPKTYIGWLFKSNKDSVQPVKAIFTTATSGTGYSMDPIAGTQQDAGVGIKLNSISNGLANVTLTDFFNNNAQSQAYASAYKSGNTVVLFVISTDSGDNKSPYNVLLVSQ